MYMYCSRQAKLRMQGSPCAFKLHASRALHGHAVVSDSRDRWYLLFDEYHTSVLSVPLNNAIPPMTQAGHHTAHTTKEVYTFCAAQPFAISTNVHLISFSQYQLNAYRMTGGDTA